MGMTKEKQLLRAIGLALDVLGDRPDRQGKPMLFHSYQVGMAGKTVDEQIVGFLHDLVEDSPLSLSDLEELGFDPEIVFAVDALTRKKTEDGTYLLDYPAYIESVGFSSLARRVKMLDLNDNLNRGGASPAQEAKYVLAYGKLGRVEAASHAKG